MNYLVIYPGRFHPFHLGHEASYEYLVDKFGQDSVYVATSDVQAPITSPFTYADKVKMITTLGIPSSHVVKVKNPYQSKEITNSLTPEEKNNTILIYAVSQKDMSGPDSRFKFGTKKNGEPSYLQPMPEDSKKLQPMTQHAYVTVTPTVNFRVKGVDANSASEIRKKYIEGNDADRNQIIADLYGEVYTELRDIFDQRLGLNEKMQGIIYGKQHISAGDQPVSIMREHKKRLVSLLETVQRLEKIVRTHHQPLNEDLIEDYIDEKIRRKK